MPVNPDPEAFKIRVQFRPDGLNVPITAVIDLSRPEFEKQVLAAAGRFRALRRQKVGGGKPKRPVICGICKKEFPSFAAMMADICSNPSKPGENGGRPARPVQCPECLGEFPSISAFNGHSCVTSAANGG